MLSLSMLVCPKRLDVGDSKVQCSISYISMHICPKRLHVMFIRISNVLTLNVLSVLRDCILSLRMSNVLTVSGLS